MRARPRRRARRAKTDAAFDELLGLIHDDSTSDESDGEYGEAEEAQPPLAEGGEAPSEPEPAPPQLPALYRVLYTGRHPLNDGGEDDALGAL